MYHYYYESREEEHPQAVSAPAEASPSGPVRPGRPAGGGDGRPPRRRRRSSERGAVAVMAALTLVLGGTAVWMTLQAGPVELPAPGQGVFAPGEVPSGRETPAAERIGLERYPNGDGTVLTLEAKPGGEGLTLQEIYPRVIPSIVSIEAQLPEGMSQGTGVVMSADGYIITNSHVIEGAWRVDLSLEDGRRFSAGLVGSDPATDLAVLKVEAGDLTPAVFGDSEDMVVGDMVAAIGNPMGEELRGTMTDGILSAINRDMEVDGSRMTLLQTTAALNTGNSGGALVNDQGQIIGITNMKLVSTVYNNTLEGLGFAIPTATVKPVVDALIAEGYVSGRPSLGVTVRGMSGRERAERGVDRGILVVEVSPDSDACGKLEPEDILLSANGVDLYENGDLLAVRDGLSVGEEIGFQVDRGGARLEVTVRLGEQKGPD